MVRNWLGGLAAIGLVLAPCQGQAQEQDGQENTRPVDAAISLGATGWSPPIPEHEAAPVAARLPWEAFLLGLGILLGVLLALGSDVAEDDGRGPGNNASPGTGG